ncbi:MULTISPECIES: hypothetical protein [unclassified Caballeronia]|uniref:hypothetical protein n=1 Tax=unclassified Caballeronia TaxID=2646786 RepID=UPI0028625F53|nr:MULTISPECIES: hypothetical protein [unclassified Caballeronia]MDR5776235.1 hypothetical protein [Caballeronia sp. LZ002]MDR5851675.1 hypothetical protein [Caballeronia sp. LZ003]
MRGYIAEFGGKYCIWSEDKPQTELMDEPDLIDSLRADLQRDGIDLDMALHDSRMARVRQYGCSGGLYGPTKADLLADNRAGPDGSHVATEEEMVRLYTMKDSSME